MGRCGYRVGVRLGGGLRCCGLVLLSLLEWLSGVMSGSIGAVFGFYMVNNTLQSRATEMAPQMRGTAIAVFAFCLFMGQASGVAVCGLAIQLLHYGSTFAISGTGLALLGFWFATRIGAHRARVHARAT